MTPVMLKPAAPRSRVKYSTTEPLRSLMNKNVKILAINVKYLLNLTKETHISFSFDFLLGLKVRFVAMPETVNVIKVSHIGYRSNITIIKEFSGNECSG